MFSPTNSYQILPLHLPNLNNFILSLKRHKNKSSKRTQVETKISHKTHWVSSVWANYSWAWGKPWSVFDCPSDNPLEKMDFPSRQPLQIVSWLGWGFIPTTLSYCWDLGWLELVQVSYELPMSLWVIGASILVCQASFVGEKDICKSLEGRDNWHETLSYILLNAPKTSLAVYKIFMVFDAVCEKHTMSYSGEEQRESVIAAVLRGEGKNPQSQLFLFLYSSEQKRNHSQVAPSQSLTRNQLLCQQGTQKMFIVCKPTSLQGCLVSTLADGRFRHRCGCSVLLSSCALFPRLSGRKQICLPSRGQGDFPLLSVISSLLLWDHSRRLSWKTVAGIIICTKQASGWPLDFLKFLFLKFVYSLFISTWCSRIDLGFGEW